MADLTSNVVNGLAKITTAARSIDERAARKLTTLLVTDRTLIHDGVSLLQGVDVLALLGTASTPTGPVPPTPPDPVDSTAPTIPVGLTATAISTSQINLAWDASCDPKSPGVPANGLLEYIIAAEGVDIATVASPSEGLSLQLAGQDIGAPATPGAYGQTGSRWDVTDYGAGIGGTSDQFSYVSASTNAGDITIICKVLPFTSTSNSAKSGPMFRQSNAADAAFVHLCAFPAAQGKGVGFRYRSTAGAAAAEGVTLADIGQPVWLKLVKSSNVFTAFYSLTGKGWISLDTVTVALSGTYLAGIAVAAIAGATPVNSVVDQVNVQNLPTLACSHTGLSAGSAHNYTVRCRDRTTLNVSAPSASVSATTLAASSGWYGPFPAMAAADMSLIAGAPKAAGLQTEAGLKSGARLTLIVTSTSTNFVNGPGAFTAVSGKTRHYRTANLRDVLQISQATVNALGGTTGTPIVVLFETSGSWTFNMEVGVTISNMSVLGQSAPAPGVQIRRTNLRIWGNDVVFHHITLQQGNTGSSPDLTNADGVQWGGEMVPGTGSQRSGYVNCSILCATDESVEAYLACNDVFTWQCFIYAPLHVAGRSDGQSHATGAIASLWTDRVSYLRTVFHGGQYRMPCYATGPKFNLIGGYTYHSQRSSTSNWNQWFCLDAIFRSQSSGGAYPNVAQFLNIAEHGFIQGPNTVLFSGPFDINYGNVTGAPFVAGSRMYLADNWLHGNAVAGATNGADTSWGKDTSNQANLVTNYNGGSGVTGFITTTRQDAIYPTGMTTLAKPTSKAEKRARVALYNSIVGSRPGDRTAGYDTEHLAHALNAIDGITTGYGQGQAYNALAYATFAVNTHNVYALTIPYPDDPDTLVTTPSSRQITKAAQWAIRRERQVSLVDQPSLLEIA